MPNALVLRTAGTNCDEELVRALTLAGASVQSTHLDALVREPERLEECRILGLPGGFSYGDDIASGRIFAMIMREHLVGPIARAVERGMLVIGICNGFQVLVQTGLLPTPPSPATHPGDEPAQRCALVLNDDGRFRDDWARLEVSAESNCVWTRGLDAEILIPYANGEGRFVASEPVLDELEAGGQIALRYADGVNGSARRIAGVCDPSGRVLGLMPHPERFLDWTRHPHWTRLDASARSDETPGLRIFRNAVDAAQGVSV